MSSTGHADVKGDWRSERVSFGRYEPSEKNEKPVTRRQLDYLHSITDARGLGALMQPGGERLLTVAVVLARSQAIEYEREDIRREMDRMRARLAQLAEIDPSEGTPGKPLSTGDASLLIDYVRQCKRESPERIEGAFAPSVPCDRCGAAANEQCHTATLRCCFSGHAVRQRAASSEYKWWRSVPLRGPVGRNYGRER